VRKTRGGGNYANKYGISLVYLETGQRSPCSD